MGKQGPDPKPKSNPNTSLVDVPAATDMSKASIPSSLLPQPSWFTAKRYEFLVFFTSWFSRILNLNASFQSLNCNYKVWFTFLGRKYLWGWFYPIFQSSRNKVFYLSFSLAKLRALSYLLDIVTWWDLQLGLI